MNTRDVLDLLVKNNIISSSHAAEIRSEDAARPFSLHWELRSMLYLGILLFSGGTGVLIYKNIDTLGHQFVIGLIALVTIGCFTYAWRTRNPFKWQETGDASSLHSYILLLACTAFLTLEGYLQFQYQIFGEQYGLAVLIPTILFFFCAYFFDHRGVLSMGITGLASWVGLTIAPLSVLEKNDFSDPRIVHFAIILGVVLIATGMITSRQNLKKHFDFIYQVLGGNLGVIASLAGLFSMNSKWLYFLMASGFSAWFIIYARAHRRLLLLLMGVIYGYIAITYWIADLFPEILFPLMLIYFIGTAVGVIAFILNIKMLLGKNEDTSI